jgi:glutathione S-transferase
MAKIPYILKETRILNGDQRSDEFSKINPDRKVPAIRDPENGFTLFESHAIMRYLANSSSLPDNFYPKDYIQRAKVDSYLDWHHSNTRKAGWLIFNTMVAP